ncbi:MAG: hypothetical protein GY828_07450 [Candidatus Gracilibacteria bacterium]|nr:hypothetical protein [Candidatus Gracilibacteria bacterium]
MAAHQKQKNIVFRYLSHFISFSIYILMGLVALFLFYKVTSLTYYIFIEVLQEIKMLGEGNFDFINGQSNESIFLIENFLSNITFILILVKAFRILEFYAKHHHIEITDLVEISIIALIMEVVFNFSVHSIEINILFGVVGIALLITYAGMPYFKKRENNV